MSSEFKQRVEIKISSEDSCFLRLWCFKKSEDQLIEKFKQEYFDEIEEESFSVVDIYDEHCDDDYLIANGLDSNNKNNFSIILTEITSSEDSKFEFESSTEALVGEIESTSSENLACKIFSIDEFSLHLNQLKFQEKFNIENAENSNIFFRKFSSIDDDIEEINQKFKFIIMQKIEGFMSASINFELDEALDIEELLFFCKSLPTKNPNSLTKLLDENLSTNEWLSHISHKDKEVYIEEEESDGSMEFIMLTKVENRWSYARKIIELFPN